jgi:hypothetical protein
MWPEPREQFKAVMFCDFELSRVPRTRHSMSGKVKLEGTAEFMES